MNAATPLRLPVGHDNEWCFGWWHPPAASTTPGAASCVRGPTVVLCPPIGYESVFSYPTQVQIARHLADQGLPVLRIDYHGTGDSAGDDRQADRVAAWLDSIELAVAEARRRSGGGAIALLGIRLGATLAVEAASRLGGVDSLLLWAPCATGKAFLREMRAQGDAAADGSLHGFGYHFSAQTVRELEALDARKPAQVPARRALLLLRDDVAVAGPLPCALAALGVEVQQAQLPGYAAMMSGDPAGGVLDAATLDHLSRWLLDSTASTRLDPPPVADDWSLESAVTGGVRERTLRFGPQHQLVGVLAEPVLTHESRRKTGVILLNVGGNYRVGPHRFYVTASRALAEAGWRTLRLDLAGLGDSMPQPGKRWANLYDRDSQEDVRSAMNELAALGCREFVLMGVCSGSYVAFQTAQGDPRVGGIVLMNSRLLEWKPGQPGDGWQDAMQQHAKSTDWYIKAALTRDPWLRLLRGEVNVRLIGRRFAEVARARFARLLASDAPDTVRGTMQALCRRGTDALMVVSDADDGRDYVEFHFGAEGRRMREHRNFRMTYVEAADHTFSRPGNQEKVVGLLLRHMEQRTRRSHAATASGNAATTGATQVAPG